MKELVKTTALGIIHAEPAHGVMNLHNSRLHRIETSRVTDSSILDGNCKLLVVDDCQINRTILKRQLEPMGYRVQLASNGLDALEQISSSPVDLIFMDCNMPGMDGYEATRLLRQKEEKRKHTIVVALTANTDPDHRTRCLAAGMNDYLNKPVSRQTLLHTLEQWLSPLD